MLKQEIKRKGKDSFRKIMSCAPMLCRRYLTVKKNELLTKHLFSPIDLKTCEEHSDRRFEMVQKYKQKNPSIARKLDREIQNAIKNQNSAFDKEKTASLRDDIDYAYFAYGFLPFEYIWYNLKEKDIRTFISETERKCVRFTMNDFSQSVFADKAKVYAYFKKWYGRSAVAVESKKDFKKFEEFIEKHPTFVVKIVNSTMGKGVWLQRASEDHRRDFNEILKHGKVLLEECIKQREEMGLFNASSVNTARVSMYLTKDGPRPVHGLIRTGRNGSFVDNAGSGGIFARADVERGVVISDGIDKQGNPYKAHPETGIVYKGFKLPDWDEALKLLNSATQLFPEVKYKSFDLAYSENGWVIVEINPSGDYGVQGCMQTGLKETIRTLMKNMDLICPYTFR